MRLFIKLFFLTLVLTCRISLAAPVSSNPPRTIKPGMDSKEKVSEPTPEKIEPTRLSYPPGNLIDVNENITPDRHISKTPDDISIHLGVLYGQIKTSEKTELTQYLGFVWTHREESQDSSWGISFDAHSNQTIGAEIFRRLFFPDSEIPLSPYAKYGLVSYFEPTEFLGTFINITRFKVNAAIGFADLIDKNEHWYGEAGTALGAIGGVFYLEFGYYHNF